VSRHKEDLVKTILVGVDGSPGGQTALEFAAREAAAHGATLRLLSAWEVPASVLSGGGVPPELYENFEGEARKLLDAAIARVTELEPSVSVEVRVAEGHPGNALVDATAEADLVVIGRRGRGGLAEFLLGSISHQVADHAKCPVVIVPWEKV
jgi:nucleotide-binding universal stress UspA family protein